MIIATRGAGVRGGSFDARNMGERNNDVLISHHSAGIHLIAHLAGCVSPRRSLCRYIGGMHRFSPHGLIGSAHNQKRGMKSGISRSRHSRCTVHTERQDRGVRKGPLTGGGLGEASITRGETRRTPTTNTASQKDMIPPTRVPDGVKDEGAWPDLFRVECVLPRGVAGRTQPGLIKVGEIPRASQGTLRPRLMITAPFHLPVPYMLKL